MKNSTVMVTGTPGELTKETLRELQNQIRIKLELGKTLRTQKELLESIFNRFMEENKDTLAECKKYEEMAKILPSVMPQFHRVYQCLVNGWNATLHSYVFLAVPEVFQGLHQDFQVYYTEELGMTITHPLPRATMIWTTKLRWEYAHDAFFANSNLSYSGSIKPYGTSNISADSSGVHQKEQTMTLPVTQSYQVPKTHNL